MNRERILAVLYDMALATGGATEVRPLVATMLQKLLFHTSFPCGLFLVSSEDPSGPAADGTADDGTTAARLELVIGDHRLAACAGCRFRLPPAWAQGKPALLDDPGAVRQVFGEGASYRFVLRLPLPGVGVFLLLSREQPASDLPFAHVFDPVLANFARTYELCRVHEAYTGRLREDRDQARAQMRLLSMAVEQSPNAVMITDAEGRLEYVNPAFTAMTGFTPEEALGKTPRLIKSERTPLSVHQFLWQTLTSGRRFLAELENRRKDGTYYWVHASISPVADEQGKILHYLAAESDITERRQAEEAMAEARARHDEAQRRSAAELERLYLEAQEAVRARDEFLSVASHELRTPVTGLLLSLQSLQAGPPAGLPPGTTRMLEIALRQTRRLALLANELINVSELDERTLQLRLEAVDLGAVLREVTAMLETEARRAQCTFDLRVKGAVVGHWDRARVEQIATYLLSNAIKFGAGGPIEIEVAAGAELATLVVRDHGIGMLPADLQRVFDRYVRAVSSRHYGGLGLGLYLVRQLAEALGGGVRAESEPGAGATFTVSLPRAGPGAATAVVGKA